MLTIDVITLFPEVIAPYVAASIPGRAAAADLVRFNLVQLRHFTHDRHQILKAVKHELGPAAHDFNFNAYADNRSLFRYEMHALPSEISSAIGTSTLFAAWNAAIYVAQVEEDRLAEAVSDTRYLEATSETLQKHGGLWFLDESYVISRRRN